MATSRQQLQMRDRLTRVSHLLLAKLRTLQVLVKRLTTTDTAPDLSLLQARFIKLKEQAVYYSKQSDIVFNDAEGTLLTTGVEHRKFFDEVAIEIARDIAVMRPSVSSSGSSQSIAFNPDSYYYRMENVAYENANHTLRVVKHLAKNTVDSHSRQATLLMLSQAYTLCQGGNQTPELEKLKHNLAEKLTQLAAPVDSTASIVALLLQLPWCLADEEKLMHQSNAAGVQLCIQGYVETQRDLPLPTKPIRQRVFIDLDNTVTVDDGGISGSVQFIALEKLRPLILQSADDVDYHIVTSRFAPDLSRVSVERVVDEFEQAIGKKIFRSIIQTCGISKAIAMEDKYLEHHAYSTHSARSNLVLLDDQLSNLIDVRSCGFSGIQVEPNSTSHVSHLAAVILPLPTASQIAALRSTMRLYAMTAKLSPKLQCYTQIQAALTTYVMELHPVAEQEVKKWKLPPLGSKLHFGVHSRLHNQHAIAIGLLAMVKRIVEQPATSSVVDDYVAAFDEQWQKEKKTLRLFCKTHSPDLVVPATEAGRLLVERIDTILQHICLSPPAAVSDVYSVHMTKI